MEGGTIEEVETLKPRLMRPNQIVKERKGGERGARSLSKLHKRTDSVAGYVRRTGNSGGGLSGVDNYQSKSTRKGTIVGVVVV
jgi:hypothetical protein